MNKEKGGKWVGGIGCRESENTNSGYKIIWGDIMDSIVAIVSNIALYI